MLECVNEPKEYIEKERKTILQRYLPPHYKCKLYKS